MITHVSLVSVWVTDLDDAKAFYTDVLGFEVGDDLTLGPDFRWLTVVHPGQPELHLHLTTPGPPLSPDLVEAMRRAQAVEFIQEPQDRPYGVEALMRDNSGNWIVLVEAKPYTEADFADFDPS